MAWFDNPAFYTSASVVATALISGAFAFFAGRRKSRADTDITLVGGFQDLLKEFKEDRVQLAKRIIDLEFDRKVLERRVDQLELILAKHGIEVPPIADIFAKEKIA